MSDVKRKVSEMFNCDNCDWEGGEEKLDDVCDLFERVHPGDVMPAGQCPECQALCFVSSDQGGE